MKAPGAKNRSPRAMHSGTWYKTQLSRRHLHSQWWTVVQRTSSIDKSRNTGMLTVEPGIWASIFNQSDLDLTTYINPQPDCENALFPKTLIDEPYQDLSVDAVDDLLRSLAGDSATTPPPSESDVLLPEEPTTLIPTPVFDSTPPSTPKPQDELDREEILVPRHKRPAHKRAEVKRRGKIKTNLDDLRDLLPPIHNQRKSESLILSRATDHCRQLKAERARVEEEKSKLRAEIAALTAEIDSFQKDLPAMGLKADGGVVKTKSMDNMYKEYVEDRTRGNWKFWIFSFMMRPLFETYTTGVSTSTLQSFMSSVSQWTEDTLGLANLRSVITRGVLRISKETSILTKPETLQQEAAQSTESSVS
ncbi:carbohydrate-responsive element-binding protein-like isoform X1 [Haliotis rufescens]|uniref:carbohydrate-responsive element-binding protein-like isoform X1 n=1 Tax=Haliotis rufescens TaxID=6454 RepID=UPI00201F8794|nr:carbohydrate-responsive element-binding protein-like isoform X1 [Haliotis rufescens]